MILHPGLAGGARRAQRLPPHALPGGLPVINLRIYIYIYIYICVHCYVYIYIYTYMCPSLSLSIYIYIYTCIYIYIYIHIQYYLLYTNMLYYINTCYSIQDFQNLWYLFPPQIVLPEWLGYFPME